MELCGVVITEELETVGAGSPAWLHNPSLKLAMAPDRLAIALRSVLVISEWIWLEAPRSSKPFATVIKIGTGDGEVITAVEWLLWDGWSALAVGSSTGVLRFYSEKGNLLVKQNMHVGAVLQLRVRGRSKQWTQDVTEDLTVVFQNNIARIDAIELQSHLRRGVLEVGSSRLSLFNMSHDKEISDAELETGKIAYQMWNVSKYLGTNNCKDAAITGVMVPALFEQQTRQRYFCAITVGVGSTIAAFRVSEDRSSTLTGMFFSRVVPATVSTISSLTKVFWRNEQKTDIRPIDVKPQDFGRASLITALKDSLRRGERLALSPTRSLAAVTDSLGRVLLVDIYAIVVVRMWKGYRDAHCMFLELRDNRLVNQPGSSMDNSVRFSRKDNFVLCLAIHAPRRGIVEIWELRNGPCISVISCTESCRLLQPSSSFWTFNATSEDEEGEYLPLHVYMLNGDSGQLLLINPVLKP